MSEKAKRTTAGERGQVDALDMPKLSYRERMILAARHGKVEGDPTYLLEEVGHQLNATRERIRQIETKGIRKLVHWYFENVKA